MIDVSQPIQPATRWTLPSPPNSVFHPTAIAVSGEHAYFASGYAGVSVVRVPALTPPSLGIERSGVGLVVPWPLSAAGHGLEETTGFDGRGDW